MASGSFLHLLPTLMKAEPTGSVLKDTGGKEQKTKRRCQAGPVMVGGRDREGSEPWGRAEPQDARDWEDPEQGVNGNCNLWAPIIMNP